MPCYTEPYPKGYCHTCDKLIGDLKDLERALCKACKCLSKDQIIYSGLLNLYVRHLEQDYNENLNNKDE